MLMLLAPWAISNNDTLNLVINFDLPFIYKEVAPIARQ